MGTGGRAGETSSSNSSMEKVLNSTARFIFAATAIAACTAATAQSFSQSDQERRERNREEVMAKHGEPMHADEPMERHGTMHEKMHHSAEMTREKTHHVAEETREKTHDVAEKTRDFTHRQAQKVRRFGERQQDHFGKAPEPAPEKTGQ